VEEVLPQVPELWTTPVSVNVFAVIVVPATRLAKAPVIERSPLINIPVLNVFVPEPERARLK